MKWSTWQNEDSKYYVPGLTTNQEIKKMIVLILKKFRDKINEPEIKVKWNGGKNTLIVTCSSPMSTPVVYFKNMGGRKLIDTVSVDLVFAWTEELWFEYDRVYDCYPERWQKKPSFLGSKLLDWKNVEMVLKKRLVSLI